MDSVALQGRAEEIRASLVVVPYSLAHAEQKQEEGREGKKEVGKKTQTHMYIQKSKNKTTQSPEPLDCCNLESGFVKI